MAESPTRPTVSFGRRQSRGVLLGFSGIRLVAIGLALVIATSAMFVAGAAGLLLAAPVWLVLLASAFVRRAGDPLVEAVPALTNWLGRRAVGQTHYRVRPTAPRPAGTMALPGDAAPLRFYEDDATGMALVHDPHRRTLTAVLTVTHPAFVLLSSDDQAARVGGWGRVMAGLAASGNCASVQVLEWNLPDPGLGIRAWLERHGVQDGSWAAQQYAALVQQTSPTTSVHRTYIALALDLVRASRAIRAAGRGMPGAAHVLAGQVATLSASLRAAELQLTGSLSAAQLAVAIRQAFDPASTQMSEHDPGANLHNAGPVAIDEHWGYLRHDASYSAVMWISEWPRVRVPPDFLHGVIFEPGIRRALSIIAKPLSTSDALRAIRKEKVEYVTNAQQNAKIGRISDLSSEQEYRDVLERERALVAGHADMRFSGFITVTADDRAGLDRAVDSVARAANQSGCETRILFGQQGQAFVVGALPLARAAW